MRSNRYAIAVVLLIIAVTAIFSLGVARSSGIQILDVVPTVNSGLVERLDVRLQGIEQHDEPLLFAIDWASNPHRWREVTRETKGTGEIAVQLAPETAMDLPPSLRDTEGRSRPRPFRVKVSRPGESIQAVSPVLSPPPSTTALTNTHFRYWDRSSARSSPFGWYVSTQTPLYSSVRVSPLASGVGVSTMIDRSSNSPSAWVEASIFQTVPSLAACYEVRLEGTNLYEADGDGRPLRATGVQITQNRTSVWWVLSTEPESSLTVLEDVVLIEIPAERNQALTIELNVESLHSRGLDQGNEAVIKLFNASLAPSSFTETTSFEWIKAARCSSS